MTTSWIRNRRARPTLSWACLAVWAAVFAAATTGSAQPPSWGPSATLSRPAPTTWPAAPPPRIYCMPFVMEPGLQEQLAEQQAAGPVIPQGPVRWFMAERPHLTDTVTGFDRKAPVGLSISKQVADALFQQGLPVVFWNNPGFPPADGWMLSGQVVSLTEGSAAAKNMIGFGVGNKQIGVDVALSDPKTAGGRPFFILDSTDKGTKMPGTVAIGAVAGFNPYVIVGKMVASSSGISDITQQGRIAGGIAEAVAESLRAHGQLPAR